MTTKILLVDDDPSQRLILRRWLSREGYEVLEARDGLGGWELACTVTPAVIICDWLMPKLNGLELCARLNAHEPTRLCYVMMLTSREGIASLIEGLETGVDEYLTKPPRQEEFLARVRHAVHKHEERCALMAAKSQLEQFALTDPLTGASNRRSLERRLATTAGVPVAAGYAVCMLDCDHFKSINDRYGHYVGDEILVSLVERLRQSLRECDELYRWGGEEFCLVLKGMERTTVLAIANCLLRQVRDQPFETAAGPLRLTLSMGVAIADGEGDLKMLIQQADEALLVAKRGTASAPGRNRVIDHHELGRFEQPPGGQAPFYGFYLFDRRGEAPGLARLLEKLAVSAQPCNRFTLWVEQTCDMAWLDRLYHALRHQLGSRRLSHIDLSFCHRAAEPDKHVLPFCVAVVHYRMGVLLQKLENTGHRLYSVYQPIVHLANRELLGHQMRVQVKQPVAADELLHCSGGGPLAAPHLSTLSVAQLSGRIFLHLIPVAAAQVRQEVAQLLQTLQLLESSLSSYVFEVATSCNLSYEELQHSLLGYREAGFALALDQVGASNVPLAAIIDLEPAFVKIDRTLICNIDTDRHRRQIVGSILTLCSQVNSTVIAEGIERAEEASTCQSLGIVYGQGSYFGRPELHPQVALKT